MIHLSSPSISDAGKAAKTFISKKNGRSYPVSACGYSFKNNPLRALWNANFYKPSAKGQDFYFKIDKIKGAEFSEGVAGQVRPYSGLIANYAKAINKSITFHPILLKEDRVLLYNYNTINPKNKKGGFICPLGAGSLGGVPRDSDEKIIDRIIKFLNDLSKN